MEALMAPARKALEERLKLPNDYRDAGHQLASTRQLASSLAQDGDRSAPSIAMDWLDGIDAWRRGERVAPLLAVLALRRPGDAERLALGYRTALALSPRALLDEGFKGAALGQELRHRRLAVLEDAWR